MKNLKFLHCVIYCRFERQWLTGIRKHHLSVFGFPVFRDDPSLYWYSYVFFVYMGVDVILVIYTAYKYVLLEHVLGAFIPCTALLVGPLCCVSLRKFHLFKINSLSIFISRVPHWLTQVLRVLQPCFAV